jgi:hypothetical protein
MNIQEVESFLDNQNWIFAKSYANTFPHSYLNKNMCSDQSKFVEVIKLIRANGKTKSFYSKQYIYLEIGNFEYWDMGRPDIATIILNRAEVDDNAGYRYPLPTNHQHEELKNKLLQRDKYLSSLLSKEEKSKEEERQIIFLMDTTRRIAGGGKNIIDNSNKQIRYE